MRLALHRRHPIPFAPLRVRFFNRTPMANAMPTAPAGSSGLVFSQLRHLRVYAEDALVLGEGSRTGVAQAAPKGGPGGGREAFVVAIAPDASCKEVGQLEMDRRAVLQGCRDGFAACYDAFVGGAASLQAGAGEGALDEGDAAGQKGSAMRDDGAGIAGLASR